LLGCLSVAIIAVFKGSLYSTLLLHAIHNVAQNTSAYSTKEKLIQCKCKRFSCEPSQDVVYLVCETKRSRGNVYNWWTGLSNFAQHQVSDLSRFRKTNHSQARLRATLFSARNLENAWKRFGSSPSLLSQRSLY
jgi:hypothetical protein